MNTDYGLLLKQLEALSESSNSYIPLLANASALLYEAMDDVNWAGFYLVRNDNLLLGPFQGKVACVNIPKGKGVCGTAYERDEILRVPDVHLFPGHIACDSASNSEIVLPIHKNNEVIAVLDIDSPIKNRFSLEDETGLKRIVEIIEEKTEWE